MHLKRPSCREASHAVVALFFGLRVEGIEAFEGRLRTMCQLDVEDRTGKEHFIFLAGGIPEVWRHRGHCWAPTAVMQALIRIEVGVLAKITFFPIATVRRDRRHTRVTVKSTGIFDLENRVPTHSESTGLCRDKSQELTRKNDADILKWRRKVADIPGHNIVGSCFQRTFYDFVIVRVECNIQSLFRNHESRDPSYYLH